MSKPRIIDLPAEYRASSQRALAPILVKLAQLQEAGMADGAILILPDWIEIGATEIGGVPVMRAGVRDPLIGLPGAPLLPRWKEV